MIDIIVMVLFGIGLFSFFSTTVGILRFPDFYSRMHAAGKGDVFSSVAMLLGLVVYHFHHPSLDGVLVAVKILMISLFIFLASPTATHAIISAGFNSGVVPWSRQKQEEGQQ